MKFLQSQSLLFASASGQELETDLLGTVSKDAPKDLANDKTDATERNQTTTKSAEQRAVLVLDFNTNKGDRFKQVCTLLKEQQKSDLVRLFVACPNTSPLLPFLQAEGITHFPLNIDKPTGLGLLLKLLWILYRKGIHIVHSQDDLSALTALSLKKIKKDKLFHIHSLSKLSAELEPRYAHIDSLICTNQQLRQKVTGLGAIKDKTFVIGPSIDDFSALNENTQDKQLAHPAKHHVFLSAGPLVREKGHTVLFQALDLLDTMDNIPPYEVYCVDSEDLSQELFEEAAEHFCFSRLAIFAEHERQDFFSRTDTVLALTSDSLVAALAIQEAWCVKKNLVCFNHAENLELLEDTKANQQKAHLTAKGDPVALANLLASLLKKNLPALEDMSNKKSYTHYGRFCAIYEIYQKAYALLSAQSKK